MPSLQRRPIISVDEYLKYFIYWDIIGEFVNRKTRRQLEAIMNETLVKAKGESKSVFILQMKLMLFSRNKN